MSGPGKAKFGCSVRRGMALGRGSVTSLHKHRTRRNRSLPGSCALQTPPAFIDAEGAIKRDMLTPYNALVNPTTLRAVSSGRTAQVEYEDRSVARCLDCSGVPGAGHDLQRRGGR